MSEAARKGILSSEARHDLDAEAVRRVRAGESEAYRELVERHHGAIFSCAYQLLHSRTDAEELTQETFVHAYRKLSQLREARYFLSWAWRICTSLSLRYRERSSRRRLGLVDDQREAPNEVSPIELDERDSAILHALAGLPDDQREALTLRFWESMSYEDMGKLLGLSNDALYQRVSRGLKRMKVLLGDDFLVDLDA